MAITDSTAESWKSRPFLIKREDSQAPTEILAEWNMSASAAGVMASAYYRSINLFISSSLAGHSEEAIDASGTALETILRHVWRCRPHMVDDAEIAIKVILTPRAGYVSRSDIVQVRLQHAELVESVVCLSSWDRLLPSPDISPKSSLLALLASAAGALIVRQSPLSTSETMRLLEQDIAMRLTFDWILPTRQRPRRVAFVARPSIFDPKSGQHGASGYFQAALALGISLVVYDEPGSWLAAEEYAHLREDFVAMEMGNLQELPRQLAHSIANRKNQIDGIVTFADEYVVAVAQAADILGLPTEPVKHMMRAHHKSRMREIVHNANIQAVKLDNADQLDSTAFVETLKTLRYPLIVKPCRGRRSKGVKKVTNEASMRRAVRMLSEDGENLTADGILIESYVQGPEFDANFALWDGQIHFLEVTDNFPCLADASSATVADNFAETVQISNTALPADHIDAIRSYVSRSLINLGFASGIFHCEGRMLKSSVRYRDVDDSGELDLVADETPALAGDKPEVFLIEVNVRPPGTGGTWATLYTYGVDLGALHLLRAVDDKERFQALSAPFAYSGPDPGDGGGAQWWTAHCMVPIPIEREQVRVPVAFFDKLFEALPDVMQHITRAEMYSLPGSVVSTTAGIGWIGYVLLGTRRSRAHALAIYRQIAAASRKLLDAHSYDSGQES